jgi:hypothetical protein
MEADRRGGMNLGNIRGRRRIQMPILETLFLRNMRLFLIQNPVLGT